MPQAPDQSLSAVSLVVYAPIDRWLALLLDGWRPSFDAYLYHHSEYSILLWRPA